jgi:hypothetical protein
MEIRQETSKMIIDFKIAMKKEFDFRSNIIQPSTQIDSQVYLLFKLKKRRKKLQDWHNKCLNRLYRLGYKEGKELWVYKVALRCFPEKHIKCDVFTLKRVWLAK